MKNSPAANPNRAIRSQTSSAIETNKKLNMPELTLEAQAARLAAVEAKVGITPPQPVKN
jgi:hypothetical protein